MAQDDGEYVEFVRARLLALKRLAYLLCGDNDRADDLVQEAVTKLYVKWSTARKADNLDAYVRSILVRVYVDERRRPWHRVRMDGDVPERALIGRGGVPAQGMGQRGVEERDVMRGALARVPAGQRAVLVLRFLCDMSVEDVSAVLGCSAGTVKSQTAHGLAKLRTLLSSVEFAALKEA